MQADERSPAGAETRVGKAELLRWASELTCLACERLDDLRTGAVLARLFLCVFPRLSERTFKPKWDPKWEWEVGLNWEVVEQMGQTLKLPPELVDRAGLQACRFKPVYSLLVTLYFLHHVARDRDFSADFVHPIDGAVAHFLQSTGAITAMTLGGAIEPVDGPGTPAPKNKSPRARTRATPGTSPRC